MRASHRPLSANARGLILSLFLVSGVSLCSATSITYAVNEAAGTGSVVGSITTDGVIGDLVQTDIVGWNLVVDDGSGLSGDIFTLLVSNSHDGVAANDLSATATSLLFNFSGTDGGYFSFFGDNGVPGDVCFSSGSVSCVKNPETAGVAILNTGNSHGAPFGYFASTSLSGTDVIATTSGDAAPEPATFALVVVGIGLFLIRGGRWSAKR